MSVLHIAIPSKGRLREKSEDWFASKDLPITQQGGARGYLAEIAGLEGSAARLLSAREIAESLVKGDLHLGVTGLDLLSELAGLPHADFKVLQPLGFGAANVIVAVPQAWLDVDSMSDLEAAGAAFRRMHGRRMRVATKYLALTRRFFAARSVGEYRLVESAGATEAAPLAGSAELIVDITSTGATLKANGLKVLQDGVILESQAVLAISANADWNAEAKSTLNQFLSIAFGNSIPDLSNILED